MHASGGGGVMRASWGGMRASRGVCMLPGGHACFRGMCMLPGVGACVLPGGCMHGRGCAWLGACVVGGGLAWLGGVHATHAPPPGLIPRDTVGQ